MTAPTPERRVGEAQVVRIADLALGDKRWEDVCRKDTRDLALDLLDERAANARLTAERDAVESAVRKLCPLDNNEGYEDEDGDAVVYRCMNEDGDAFIETESLAEAVEGMVASYDRVCEAFEAAQEEKHRLTAEVERLTNQKDGAYNERDHLVAALSKFFPASLERHPAEEEWDDDWRWIVFIELPTGQVSWHIHDSEVGYFAHLARETGRKWDGHSTPEKYARLAALSLPTPAPEGTDGNP